MISGRTHTHAIERERAGVVLVSLVDDSTRETLWVVVGIDRSRSQYHSVGPDCPRGGGLWVGPRSAGGAAYCGRLYTDRRAAMRRFWRESAPAPGL